jgi:hypothetical protein
MVQAARAPENARGLVLAMAGAGCVLDVSGQKLSNLGINWKTQ